MKRVQRNLLTVFILFNLFFPLLSLGIEDWKEEFQDICAKTQDPMALSEDELRTLINRCDKLKPVIEGLDESTRKVYLKRLKMCRDIYSFSLDEKLMKKR